MRVRELLKTMFLGKIYRDGLSTIKKHGIIQNSHLVIEILNEPVEDYSASKILLYLKKRVVKDRTYENYRIEFLEIPGEYPTLPKLKEVCAKIYNLDPEKITLAKYLTYCFSWKEIIPQVAKGKKPKKGKALDDLRQPPCLLKEGGENCLYY